MSVSNHERPRSQDSSPAITLCLSGGGFRATFFHLGVIKLLRDYGLLRRVTDVFSVSGGSILAAHLALHWESYSEPGPNREPDFYRAATELVEFGRLDLRGRIARRWLLLGWLIPRFRRTSQLESRYSVLLRNAELKDLSSSAPKFRFLTTSLTTGNLCAFTSGGFHDGERLYPASHLPLALAVAASSAFPPVFPPVNITRNRLQASAKDFPQTYNELSDGGVFDNLGVHGVRNERSDEVSPKRVIISDASAAFDWQPETRFRSVFAISARSANVMSARIARSEEERWTKELPGAILVSIQNQVKAESSVGRLARTEFFPQDENVQALVGKIRTDLDEFSKEEICALVRHGYEVALHRILKAELPVDQLLENEQSDPCVFAGTRAWPYDPEVIPKYRATSTLVKIVLARQKSIEELDEAGNDLLGLPSAPKQDEKNEGGAEIEKLRSHLRRSSATHLRLWNANDWVSWSVLGIMFVFGLLLWFFAG